MADQFLSYADKHDHFLKRALIHALEQASGVSLLRQIYQSATEGRQDGESFWQGCLRGLKLNLVMDPKQLALIPATGPLVVVANHPYGILDGIVLNHIVNQVRGDTKILLNSALTKIPALAPVSLPVDFAGTDEARATNRQTRARAMQHVQDGGALLIFPGGGVATSQTCFGPAVDFPWRPFTAEVIHQAQAAVVPIFFEGQNSRLFQIVSQFSQNARLGLLFREVIRRMGTDFEAQIGSPIAYPDLLAYKDSENLIRELQARTMSLAKGAPASLDRRSGFSLA